MMYYKLYEGTAKKAIENHMLTAEEIEAIYRYQQMMYRTEDIKNHAVDMLHQEEIGGDDYVLVTKNAELLADRYIYKYEDCTLAEFDVMRELIFDFIAENEDSMDE